MEGLFCGSSLNVRAVGFFCREALMSDGASNETLSEKKVSTIGVTQGNLKLLLPSNTFDSYQTQAQYDELLD